MKDRMASSIWATAMVDGYYGSEEEEDETMVDISCMAFSNFGNATCCRNSLFVFWLPCFYLQTLNFIHCILSANSNL